MHRPSSALRVSDADRDRAIAELSEHFQAGRLTSEELDDRIGRALRARTYGDLADLFADLPGQQPAAPAPVPVPVPAPAPVPVPAPARPGSFGPAPTVAPIVILAVFVAVGLISGHPALIALVPVIAVLVVKRLSGSRGRRSSSCPPARRG